MSEKDLVIEAMKQLITEEQIDNAIRSVVADHLGYRVECAIKEKAESIAREYCDKKIEDVLKDLYGKEVNLDDGFCGRKGYKSFEEFVRDYVGEQCRKQWNMERKVQDMVKERVSEVCKKVVEENEADLADKAMRILSGERESE